MIYPLDSVIQPLNNWGQEDLSWFPGLQIPWVGLGNFLLCLADIFQELLVWKQEWSLDGLWISAVSRGKGKRQLKFRLLRQNEKKTAARVPTDFHSCFSLLLAGFFSKSAFIWDQSGIRIIGMMRVSVCLGAILIPEYLDFHCGYSAPRSSQEQNSQNIFRNIFLILISKYPKRMRP